MLDVVNRTYIPNGIFAFVEEGINSNQLEKLPFFSGKLSSTDSETYQSTRAYVCKELACSQPMYTSDELENYIKSSNLSPE
jgi:uncharacterized protein YyaL (SSP411 family)